MQVRFILIKITLNIKTVEWCLENSRGLIRRKSHTNNKSSEMSSLERMKAWTTKISLRNSIYLYLEVMWIVYVVLLIKQTLSYAKKNSKGDGKWQREQQQKNETIDEPLGRRKKGLELVIRMYGKVKVERGKRKNSKFSVIQDEGRSLVKEGSRQTGKKNKFWRNENETTKTMTMARKARHRSLWESHFKVNMRKKEKKKELEK